MTSYDAPLHVLCGVLWTSHYVCHMTICYTCHIMSYDVLPNVMWYPVTLCFVHKMAHVRLCFTCHITSRDVHYASYLGDITFHHATSCFTGHVTLYEILYMCRVTSRDVCHHLKEILSRMLLCNFVLYMIWYISTAPICPANPGSVPHHPCRSQSHCPYIT